MKVKTKVSSADCSYNSKIVCPFCGLWFDGDNEDGEVQCPRCERDFYVEAEVTVSYCSYPKTYKCSKGYWDCGDEFEDGLTQEEEDYCMKREKDWILGVD